ncbi:MAG: AAA-type ATPase lid domain-containing protein, partial [Planctomycetota bacterium]
PVFSDEAIRALEAWRWPGNVRELQNELRRAIALGGNPLQASDFSTHVSQALQEH